MRTAAFQTLDNAWASSHDSGIGCPDEDLTGLGPRSNRAQPLATGHALFELATSPP